MQVSWGAILPDKLEVAHAIGNFDSSYAMAMHMKVSRTFDTHQATGHSQKHQFIQDVPRQENKGLH